MAASKLHQASVAKEERPVPVSKVDQPKVEPKHPTPLPARPIVPPVTNLPSGVVLPTTPLQPQQLNCPIRPHKMPATTAATSQPLPPVVQPPPPPKPQPQPPVHNQSTPKVNNPPAQPYPSSVSPTTIQAMLASVKPVVSMAQMVSGRSSLRNYRRSKNPPAQPIKTDTSNGNKSLQTVIGTRTLPSDISVTPVMTKSTTVSNDIKRPIEHQPPSVSCYPINKEVVEREMSIDDLVAAKKLKDERTPGASPSQQNNRSFQLPKGLTITEISSKNEKPNTDKVPIQYEVQALPVLHIPDVPTSSSSNSSAGKGTGHHFDLLKKFDEANSGPGDKRPGLKSTNGMVGGHPGMPNGLLRMTASLQQKSEYSRPGIGRIQTKVTPKDLKSQMALTRIGLPMDNNGFGKVGQSDNNGFQVNQTPVVCGSTITVSMAQSAASAVSIFNSKPVPKTKIRTKQPNHSSPASSQSSSRNGSISPRDRSGSTSAGSKFPVTPSRQSPSSTPKPGTASQISPKTVYKQTPGKKKINPPAGPLLSWAKRGGGPPKHSNGWSWIGEGTEHLVYLSVSENALSNFI